MNEIFSIKRFWQTLRHDIVYTASKNGASIVLAPMAVMLITALLVTSFEWILGEQLTTYPFIRLMIMVTTYSVMMLLMASRCFGYLTDGRQNISYLMLPSSTLEKTISICIIYYLLVPVTILVSGYAADSILTLFRFGGFESYMIPETISGICSDDPSEWPQELTLLFKNLTAYMVIGHFAMLSYILLCALLFKTHKVLKTIGLYIGANMIIGTITSSALIRTTISYDYTSSYPDFEQIYSSTMTTSMIIAIVMLVAFNIGIFFTLRKMKS